MSIQRWELTSCSMRFIGKTGASISGANGFAIRAERRQQRRGQVGCEVIPLSRYVFFFQLNFDFHNISPIDL